MTREEAKNWLHKLYARADITDEYGDMEDMQPYEEAINMAISALSENKGEWIAQDIHNCCTVFKCSKCGYEHNFLHLYGKPTADYPYCPDCGAKMKGGE